MALFIYPGVAATPAAWFGNQTIQGYRFHRGKYRGKKRQEREENERACKKYPSFGHCGLCLPNIYELWFLLLEIKELFCQAINRYSLHSRDINIQTRLDNNLYCIISVMPIVSLIFTAVIKRVWIIHSTKIQSVFNSYSAKTFGSKCRPSFTIKSFDRVVTKQS